MADMIPMTEQGLRNLKEEIERLEAKRPQLLRAVKEAREQGDLSENAGYHAAREELAILENRIEDLKSKVARAQIVDPKKAGGGDVVAFGASVRILDLATGEESEYRLVGAGEADIMSNKILTTSPLGQAMLNRRPGDEFEVKGPRGTVRYRILSVTY
ncbi:MAG: transcription elongation factor GreA [Planctomycetota bacterium]|nr:transcription elongation factor GreA [Planctomycetota bacterium]